jgi:hypothetical protein
MPRAVPICLVWRVATALRFGATAVAVRIDPGINGGTTPMSYSTHLEALKQRHASLDSRIQEEDHRPRPDSTMLTRLKLEKLHLKEKMEKMSTLAH